jgi:hypothetical protein
MNMLDAIHTGKELRCLMCGAVRVGGEGWYALTIETPIIGRTFFACPTHFPSRQASDTERSSAVSQFLRRAIKEATRLNAN